MWPAATAKKQKSLPEESDRVDNVSFDFVGPAFPRRPMATGKCRRPGLATIETIASQLRDSVGFSPTSLQPEATSGMLAAFQLGAWYHGPKGASSGYEWGLGSRARVRHRESADST